MNVPDSPFFLNVNHHPKEGNPARFISQAMGHNTIGEIMKKAGERAKLDRPVSNHAARQTTVQRLHQRRFSDSMVSIRSPHPGSPLGRKIEGHMRPPSLEIPCPDGFITYKLTGVVEHRGHSVNSGHYVAYITEQNSPDWWIAEDRSLLVWLWSHLQCQRKQVYLGLKTQL